MNNSNPRSVLAIAALLSLFPAAGCNCFGSPAKRAAGQSAAAAPSDEPGAAQAAAAGSDEAGSDEGGAPAAAAERGPAPTRQRCSTLVDQIVEGKSLTGLDLSTLQKLDRDGIKADLVKSRVYDCLALASKKRTLCKALPDADAERCLEISNLFGELPEAPPSGGRAPFSKNEMEGCKKQQGMNEQLCAAVGAAVRDGKPAACPDVEPRLKALCESLASLDFEHCPTGDDWMPRECRRFVANALGRKGLPGGAKSAYALMIARAARGEPDACAPVLLEVRSACEQRLGGR